MSPGVNAFVELATTWMQLIVLAASVVTLFITVTKSAAKPNQTQNERLDRLEMWQKEVDMRLDNGNEHFDNIDHGNRITQEAILALMSHAINGNDTDKLKQAKDKLEKYLIEK